MGDVKNERVTFRLPEKELELLDKLAKKKNLKRSEYLREIVLKEIKNTPPFDITKEMLQVVIENIFKEKNMLLMDVNFKTQIISTIALTKALIYKFELIENNEVIRFRNEFGAIEFEKFISSYL